MHFIRFWENSTKNLKFHQTDPPRQTWLHSTNRRGSSSASRLQTLSFNKKCFNEYLLIKFCCDFQGNVLILNMENIIYSPEKNFPRKKCPWKNATKPFIEKSCKTKKPYWIGYNPFKPGNLFKFLFPVYFFKKCTNRSTNLSKQRLK